MEISSKLAIGLASWYRRVGRVTVAPVLAAVFEAQNESRLHRCLSECYIYGGEKLVRPDQIDYLFLGFFHQNSDPAGRYNKNKNLINSNL